VTSALIRRATALVAITLLSACGGDSQDEIDQIGGPPTHDWPLELACPSSLASSCAGKTLVLASTANLPRETVLVTAFSDAQTVLCRWPVSDPDSCRVLESGGASVKGEAAIYSYSTR
jgi:hypothetical protein